MTKIQEVVLEEVDGFTRATGMAESTLSNRAVKDSRFVRRLREGKNCSVHTLERLRDFMRNDLARRTVDRPSASSAGPDSA